jgi:hypothetical protein
MATETVSLEQSPLDEPPLARIKSELEQAQSDSSSYLQRIALSQNWWQCQWDGMLDDGRNWDNSAFPWRGCSDSRLHIVETIVQEHVTLDLVAFWSAKVQCKSIRPFVYGEQSSVADRMLRWRVYTHMKRELLRELPLAFVWKHALGLAFMGIEWEQERQIIDVPINVQMIDQIITQLGMGSITDLMLDPDRRYDDQLVAAFQALSPILPKADARGIITDLRNTGQSTIPTVSLRINKPVWTARRPGIDTIIPSETVDVQKARWLANRELVSETELEDRIETDGYDPDFVEQAIKHKGTFAGFTPRTTPDGDQNIGSNRDMIEVYHFYCRYMDKGVPCMYVTVFNDAALGNDNLYAVHRKFEYDHQQYPVVAMRRKFSFRPLLSSIGIADESYTDERDIKYQQDGLNNHSDIVLRPPMIVPTLRAQAVANTYGPRAVMPAMRPSDVQWPPIPPMDQIPLLVMQQVQLRLDRRYPITGGAVDPEIKAVHRQQLANQCLGEMELCLEMTHQLQQQYETDADVQRVAGGNQPWKFSKADIQGQHEVSATVDIMLIDQTQAEMKLDMLAKMMPFKDAGGLVFKAAAEIIDPDLAEAITQDQMSPTAQQRERTDEMNAIAQMRVGMEPDKPMMANNNLRLQTIQQVLQQPNMAQAFMQDPVSKTLLENRIKFFTSQIQQFQKNPQIGRTLAVSAFDPSQPAQVTKGPPQ